MKLFSWLASFNGSFQSIQIIESMLIASHLWYNWWFRNLESVEVGRWSHYLQAFSTIPGGWPWDFFDQQYHSSYKRKVNSSPCIRTLKDCSQKHILSSFPRPTPRLEMHRVESLHPSRPHQGNVISDLHALHWSGAFGTKGSEDAWWCSV